MTISNMMIRINLRGNLVFIPRLNRCEELAIRKSQITFQAENLGPGGICIGFGLMCE